MKKLGFFRSLYNSVLYFNSQKTYVIVYINNLHIVGPNLSLINELKIQLVSKFKIINLDSIPHYLGIKGSWEDDTITVMQMVYINQVLNAYQISNCNLSFIPMVKNINLAPTSNNYLLNVKDLSAYK